MDFIKKNWSVIGFIISLIIIAFFAGRGTEARFIEKMALENADMKAMLNNTNIILQEGLERNAIDYRKFVDIGYRLEPPKRIQLPDTSQTAKK